MKINEPTLKKRFPYLAQHAKWSCCLKKWQNFKKKSVKTSEVNKIKNIS